MKRKPLVVNANIIEQLQAADYIEHGRLNIGACVQLTLSANAITISKSFHSVYIVTATATLRQLKTINGGILGDLLVLVGTEAGNDISVQDNDGNLRLAGNFTLSSETDTLTLLYNGSVWIEIARTNGG